MITTEQLKALRDETGVSVMQCKKALEEAGGDMEKARILLKKKSGDAAAKKADRELGAGLIVTAQNAEKIVVLSLLCETDFVAKNDDFVAVAKKLAEKALTEGKEVVESNSSEDINGLIQKVGENVKLGEILLIDAKNSAVYNHNGQFASVVTLQNEDTELAKDIAMHTTAMRPGYLTETDVPEEAKNRARETFQKEADEQAAGKPEDIKAKILEGKVNSYFADQVLVKQAFIKDPSKTIGQLAQEKGNAVISFKVIML
jgi:elongation factor Ts